jgi:hypothetical protein
MYAIWISVRRTDTVRGFHRDESYPAYETAALAERMLPRALMEGVDDEVIWFVADATNPWVLPPPKPDNGDDDIPF